MPAVNCKAARLRSEEESGIRRFVELHGDRAGLDDPAMVCGLASMDGISFMFIGHQKGRNTKVGSLDHSLSHAALS